MEFEVIKGSVVYSNADAIVNAANRQLLYGGGVCGAIFEAAGWQDLQDECDLYEGCETGKAVLTHGYNLKAKYVIHAVGPIYDESKNPQEDLKNAYLSSLNLAEETNLETIAFPCISVGIYGFPLKEASKIAVNTIKNYHAKSLKKCYFYCYREEEYLVYQDIIREMR